MPTPSVAPTGNAERPGLSRRYARPTGGFQKIAAVASQREAGATALKTFSPPSPRLAAVRDLRAVCQRSDSTHQLAAAAAAAQSTTGREAAGVVASRSASSRARAFGLGSEAVTVREIAAA